MKKEMSILEKAGIADPLRVFDNRGHIQETMFRNFVLYPDTMNDGQKKEVERHLNWCKNCQERQKQKFLPIEGGK